METTVGATRDTTVTVNRGDGRHAHRPSGAAVAAMLSIGIGAVLMAIVVGVSDANKPFESDVIHAIGKLWVPGAPGIGPYSGKFTVFLVGWLASWGLLHLTLKGRDVDLSRWAIISFAVIGLALLLVWPPITLWLFVR